MYYTIKWNSCNFSVVFLLRLFGNSRSIDLWPQRLQTGQDSTVPAANESPYLCPRLHSRCHYSGCGCDSTKAQAVTRRQTLSDHTNKRLIWSMGEMWCECGMNWTLNANCYHFLFSLIPSDWAKIAQCKIS